MGKILFDYTSGSFIVTKENFEVFKMIQDSLLEEDISNLYLYREVIDDNLRKLNFSPLEDVKSVYMKSIVYHLFSNNGVSLMYVVQIAKNSLLCSIEEYLEQYKELVVNSNGGFFFGNIIMENFENRDFIQENIHFNDTMNLIIENSTTISGKIKSKIDSCFEPSVITNFKRIFKFKDTQDFLKSRKDWVLWVETQGLDFDLYEKFLDMFSDYIEEINVLTSNEKILFILQEKFMYMNINKI